MKQTDLIMVNFRRLTGLEVNGAERASDVVLRL
jgi:hypothetical protein